MRTDSLGIAWGVKTDEAINLLGVAMSGDDGHANDKNVASYSAIGSETINVGDDYDREKFSFSGAKGFDESAGCRSTSFLTAPLNNCYARVAAISKVSVTGNGDRGRAS